MYGKGTIHRQKIAAGAVFETMINAGYDVLVQNGDFDYQDCGTKWIAFLDTAGKIILSASGNHEEELERRGTGRAAIRLT